MKLRARVDSNQKEIVEKLRELGYGVQSLAQLGKGVPDLLISIQTKFAHPFNKINLLMEIKDGNKPLSSRKLTADEKNWHESWKGQVAVVNNIEEALAIINQYLI